MGHFPASALVPASQASIKRARLINSRLSSLSFTLANVSPIFEMSKLSNKMAKSTQKSCQQWPISLLRDRIPRGQRRTLSPHSWERPQRRLEPYRHRFLRPVDLCCWYCLLSYTKRQSRWTCLLHASTRISVPVQIRPTRWTLSPSSRWHPWRSDQSWWPVDLCSEKPEHDTTPGKQKRIENPNVWRFVRVTLR